MNDHAPSGYVCPFCRFVQGNDTPANTRGDVVYQDDEVMAFVAPRWWPNNPGNVIVIPISHSENIYAIPDDILSRIIVVARRLAIAIKEVYRCDGTSLRQHNEPGGGQDVFHFHLHVFPRYVDDELYQLTNEHRFASHDERHPYAQELRAFLEALPSPEEASSDEGRQGVDAVATGLPEVSAATGPAWG
jgi:histidine triad (HIT) family protein